MIKIIFFDIDGTLIDHETKKMPLSTKETLNKLKKQGIKLFVATGRTPNNLGVIEGLFDFDGYLCANGQYIYNQQELIYQASLKKDALDSLIRLAKTNKYKIALSTEKATYINMEESVFIEDIKLITDYKIFYQEPVLQANVFVPSKEDAAFLKELVDVELVRWTEWFADILPQGGGKQRGIDQVLAYYGYDISETMAFGDGGNDIKMLEHVCYGVAMGNAEQKVKDVSNYVTDQVNNDGITKALRYYKVIK